MCHCGLKSRKEFGNKLQPHPFLWAFLHTFCTEKGRGHCISVKNHDTHTETDKFIYKALTLHGKEFLHKRDRSRSHKSAVYFQKCLPAKNILEILSHSWKGLIMAPTIILPTNTYVSIWKSKFFYLYSYWYIAIYLASYTANSKQQLSHSFSL